MLICGYILIILFYRSFVKPVKELQKFSVEIAKGNLDEALPIRKNNLFGNFVEGKKVAKTIGTLCRGLCSSAHIKDMGTTVIGAKVVVKFVSKEGNILHTAELLSCGGLGIGRRLLCGG